MNLGLAAAGHIRWVTAALCLSAAYVHAQIAVPVNNEGQRVLAVRLVDESGGLLQENPSDLPLAPGQPYDSDAIRETLRQLYRTGLYADIRVEAVSAEGGVRVDFVVQQNFYVNVVRVLGLREPPGEATALAAMRLGLGEVFRESLLREPLERLRETLREEGFYQAQLTHALGPHPDTRQMDITVRVAPGPRARIGAVEIIGPAGFPKAQILGKSKLKPGRELTSARLERASERLRKFIVKKGHLGARISIRRGAYDEKTDTLPLTIELVAGPKVRIEVTGAKIPGRELGKLLPIYQEGAVDEDLLQEGRRNLRDFLERDGYFDSQVRYTLRDDPEKHQQVILYEVERGPRRRLVGISFAGNKYFSEELLRDRLRIQPAGFLSRGRFRGSLLGDDEDSIRGLYLANGFREAQVRAELDEGNPSGEGDLFVRFVIHEGPQTLISELRLEGNRALRDEYLLSEAIDSGAGQPYSEFNISSDRANVLAVYFNEGFPEARFEAHVAESGGPNRVRLTYRIAEGPQSRVERVLVGGLEHTRAGIVEREVLLRPGEPLRARDVVNTQRNLYDLGIFSRVSIAAQNPAGTDLEKTLLVQVEEAKRYTIAYGGGVEVQRLGGAGTDPVGGEVRASPRGLFEITRANFLGRAHIVAFKARGSALQGRALLSYTAPKFWARPDLTLLLTGFADKTRDVRTFTSTRYEASTQLVQHVSEETSLLYRYSFRRVLVDPGSLKISPAQIPLLSQPTKISGLGLTWIRDRRKPPTDATRGDFNTLDVSFAAAAFGSSASFFRAVFQNSTFFPLGRRLVFARSTRFGIQEPLGATVDDQIPLPERFFAGGGNSLRGFGLNQAGRRDPTTGFPIGGHALLVFNQELRFPMQLPILGGRLGGALFYDAGNVFSRLDRITLRTTPTQAAITSGKLDYFSHTIGFGFRYGTPIGPVRVDLGYQLNATQFRFCVPATGTSPTCPAGTQIQISRLPRFQFFVNIGSIF